MSKKEKTKEKNHLESVTDKIGEISINYGFSIVKAPAITNDDYNKARHFKENDFYGDVEEKIALTRWYIDNKLDSEAQPISIQYKKPLPGSKIRKKNSVETYGLEIMGSNRPTSEALLLKCTLAILDDLGYENLYLDINSIGDKESIARFDRELGNYLRKHGAEMPTKLRQEIKKNPYSILKNDSAEAKEFKKHLPQPISHLSDLGRIHFKEVLECIESFGVMYKINPSALSNKAFASHTVFEIRQMKDGSTMSENDELLAYGYRYNYLAKKIGGKREIPSIGATITVKSHPLTKKKVIIKNIKKPKFYLVQLGSAAKIKALNVVEMLRKDKIAVYHSITKDKITGQLTGAEYMKTSHVLIMGQKEAIENSMVVRDVVTREQETVKVENLGEFLRKLGREGKK